MNPATQVSDEIRATVETMLAEGNEFIPPVGSDIALEGVTENAYDATPRAGVAHPVRRRRRASPPAWTRSRARHWC